MRTLRRKAVHGYGLLNRPMLRFIARRRKAFPEFQALADRSGFQLRSDDYYQPTYAESHLPADTGGERELPGLDLNEAGQLAFLAELDVADELAALPDEKPAPDRFGFRNDMYSWGDAELYYGIVRANRPRRIVEIGSGQSTLIALEAIRRNRADDPDHRCELTCVEPYEVAWLEGTGVTVVRQRVETVDLALFDTLEAGDILFIDSSHVIRPFGDVLREFQEIVPRVKPGVLIQVHDIFTPRDYLDSWLREERRLYDEQYLLESFLAFNDRYEVVCAANWLKHNHWDALTRACPGLARNAGYEPRTFWFRRTG